MKSITALAAAGLFAIATMAGALACSSHPGGHTAEISKPVTTADAPTVTPAPKTGG